MKKSREDDVRKVEEALIAAHRVQTNVPVDPEFQRDLMRHIRRLDAAEVEARPYASAWLGAVWRFAAVTCVVSFLLLYYSFNVDYSLDVEAASAIVGAPSNLVIAQAFEGV